ncbi:MAG: pyridoxal phosphate-dependent aminotransferase [Blastocatellia bacterium]|nr:pyridoxal phosphate-dependent aminotransferase [Blastocatellia bacterium]
MGFSTRFKWHLASNSLALLLADKRRAQAQVLDLTQSNPTRVGVRYPAGEILQALASAEALVYEPAPRGLEIARASVSEYYRERGYKIDPPQLHLTASTSEGYSYLFKLLADQGHSILAPQPSYPLFEFLAALEGIELRPYELNYQHPAGWEIDFASLERAVDGGTRAIVVVSPNNPTGSYLKKTELERLNEICARRGLALICDEVFGDYSLSPMTEYQRRAPSLVTNHSVLTFVLSGFSKILALPQMKLAWIASAGPAALRDEASERLDLIADTYLSTGAPVQHAASAWLKLRGEIQEQLRERLLVNLQALRQVPSSSRLLKVEGGWYATLEIPRYLTEEEWVLSLLEKDDVLVHPGYFFDFPREAYLILSLLPEPGTFSEAIARISARIEGFNTKSF